MNRSAHAAKPGHATRQGDWTQNQKSANSRGSRADDFGTTLRLLRRNKGRTLGETARALNISTVHLSDIERGNRRPLDKTQIEELAKWLEVDGTPLLKHTGREGTITEYHISNAPALEADVLTALISRLICGAVSETQLQEMQSVLDRTPGQDLQKASRTRGARTEPNAGLAEQQKPGNAEKR